MSQGTQGKSELIEQRIDKQVAGQMAVHEGGLTVANMGQAMEFAKMMAVANIALPSHLRNNVGACLAVCIQAIEWRMSPFAVANKTYCVNDRIAFESQLIHAVIEQRAPLVGRLRHSFAGEGQNRTCTVWAMTRGESEPFSYTSPPIGQITPKNSPLWKTKPDLQLYYNASRDWARMYFPDVIMGVYSDDEIEKLTVDGVATAPTSEQVAQSVQARTPQKATIDDLLPKPTTPQDATPAKADQKPVKAPARAAATKPEPKATTPAPAKSAEPVGAKSYVTPDDRDPAVSEALAGFLDRIRSCTTAQEASDVVGEASDGALSDHEFGLLTDACDARFPPEDVFGGE